MKIPKPLNSVFENAMGIVVPWATSDEEPFEILLLERIEKALNETYDDNWICRRPNGNIVIQNPSSAALLLSEGKKGVDWLIWAVAFMAAVKNQCESQPEFFLKMTAKKNNSRKIKNNYSGIYFANYSTGKKTTGVQRLWSSPNSLHSTGY